MSGTAGYRKRTILTFPPFVYVTGTDYFLRHSYFATIIVEQDHKQRRWRENLSVRDIAELTVALFTYSLLLFIIHSFIF